MRSRSAGSPHLPTAITTRPQLGSSPAMAVLTSGLLAMASATFFADLSDLAPVTVTETNLVAPSPSRTICWARSRSTRSRAAANSAARGSRRDVIGSIGARPVAATSTVSEVEVSLSTVTALKVRSVASESIFCSTSRSMAASVNTKPSIVAMSGAIIPEPLQNPAMVTRWPPSGSTSAAPLGKVSVVMIARAASSPASSCRFAFSSSSLAAIFSWGRGSPITPVEAIQTPDFGAPVALATAAASASTASTPFLPVKALELPEFTRIACGPFTGAASRRASHHSTGAERVEERVNTPATAEPGASIASITSRRPL